MHLPVKNKLLKVETSVFQKHKSQKLIMAPALAPLFLPLSLTAVRHLKRMSLKHLHYTKPSVLRDKGHARIS